MKKNLLLFSLFALIVFGFSSCEKKLSNTDLLCRATWVDFYEDGVEDVEQILKFHPNGVGVEELNIYNPYNGTTRYVKSTFEWYWTSASERAIRMEYDGGREVVLFLVDRLDRHVLEGEMGDWQVFFEAL